MPKKRQDSAKARRSTSAPFDVASSSASAAPIANSPRSTEPWQFGSGDSQRESKSPATSVSASTTGGHVARVGKHGASGHGRSVLDASATSTTKANPVGVATSKRVSSSSPGRIPGTPTMETVGSARTPTSKASPGRVATAKRLPSASPGRIASTPTLTAKASPGRVVTAKNIPLTSPGHVPGMPSIVNVGASRTPTMKASRAAARTPATKSGTSASPGRVAAAKRVPSTSPGRVASTPTLEAVGASRTPATKSGSSASPGRVSSAKRLPSASPGRVPATPSAEANRASRTPSTKASPSRIATARNLPSVSPGRVPATPTAEANRASRTASTKASPGHVATARNLPSASPGRVPATPFAEANRASRTPSTKASPGRVATARKLPSASPGRVPATPTAEANRASRTPSTKASPGRVATGRATIMPSVDDVRRTPITTGSPGRTATSKHVSSASPGRVLSTPTLTATGASRTVTAKPGTPASLDHLPTAKRVASPSPGRVKGSPLTAAGRASRTPTKKVTPSSGRVVTDSVTMSSSPALNTKLIQSITPVVKPVMPSQVDSSLTPKQAAASPVRGLSTSPSKKSTDRTPSIKPSPRARSSVAKRQKSTTPTRVSGTSASETGTDSPAQTSTGASSSPVRRVSGSAAKRHKSTSQTHASGISDSKTGTGSPVSQTSTVEPGTSSSPVCRAISSAARRQKSNTPARVSGTPSTEASAGTPQTSAVKVSTGRRVRTSASKRHKSVSPTGVRGTTVTDTGTDTLLYTSAIESGASASPRRRVGSSAAKRKQSTSRTPVPGMPASPKASMLSTPKSNARRGSRASVTSPAIQAESSRQQSTGEASRHESASPARVTQTEKSSDRHATQSSVTKRSPEQRRKSSSVNRRPSTSDVLVAGPEVAASSGVQHKGSAARRHKYSTSTSEESDSVTGGDSPVGVSPLMKTPKQKQRKSGGLSAVKALMATPPMAEPPMTVGQQQNDSVTKRRHSGSPVVRTPRSPVSQTGTDNVSDTGKKTKGSVSRRTESASPARGSLDNQKSVTPNSAKKGNASPIHLSLKLSSKRGVKRSGSPLEEPPHKQLGVSFGPSMSPELFDYRLPPITPVRRGATPRRISTPVDVLKPLLKGRYSSVGTPKAGEAGDVTVAARSAKAVKSAKRRSKSARSPFAVDSQDDGTVASTMVDGIKGKRSTQRMSVSEESNMAEHSFVSTLSPKSTKSRSKSVERFQMTSKLSLTPVQKSASKGRQSVARLPVAEEIRDTEVSVKSPKSAQRLLQTSEHGREMVETNVEKKAAKSGKKRSKSLPEVDDVEPEDQHVAKKDAKRSRSLKGSKETIAGGETAISKAIAVAQPVTASPDRGKRSPQKPFRYRSPTLETGSIKVKRSMKLVSPSPKRSRSLSAGKAKPTKTDRMIPPQMLQTPFTSGARIVKRGKPAAVKMGSSPVSSRSPKVMRPTPANVMEAAAVTASADMQKSDAGPGSKIVTSPLSAKKRKSLSASPQRVKKFPLSPGKKVNTPRSDLVNVMTPGKMVAMRAVFGCDVTPKLKVPDVKSSPSLPQTMISTPARSGLAEVVRHRSGQKAAIERSAGKLVSSKKSARKSTAKKTLWSEVVRRTAATRKSGPKIVKPVIVKARKIDAAVSAVVSIHSCAASLYQHLVAQLMTDNWKAYRKVYSATKW